MPRALEGVFCDMNAGDAWQALPADDPVRENRDAFEVGYMEKYGRQSSLMDRNGNDLANILLEAVRLANIKAEELAVARGLVRDAMEMVDICGVEFCHKYTPEDHSGLVPPQGVGVVTEGKVTFLEWVDMESNLYFPDGYNGLVGAH
jgi:hypothetical protein